MRPDERRAANVIFGQHPWNYAAIGMTVLCPMAAAVAAMVQLRDLDVTLPLYWGAAAGGLGLYFAVRHWLAPRVLEQERAWLNSLGFEVAGWFDVVGALTPRTGKLMVTVEFEGPPPANSQLDAWFGAVDAERASGKSLLFTSPLIQVRDSSRGSTFSTRNFRAWLRRVVLSVLLPIHAVHPLARVQFRFAD